VKALILAAGYATRLYPLTKEYPKPLLEVKGKAIIDYIIDKLEAVSAIDEIFVVTNHKFAGVFRAWLKAKKPQKKITLVDDLTRDNRDRLGAIGDINFAVEDQGIDEDLLVLGGDNLFSGDLEQFLIFARKQAPAASMGVYRLRRKKEASRYGVVKLDRRKRIVGLAEKPRSPQSALVAMCLYYLPASSLRLIQEYMRVKRKTDTTGGYISWLKNRVAVYGYVFGGTWFDIGDFKYLNAAKEKFA